jgi:uncharacterized protein
MSSSRISLVLSAALIAIGLTTAGYFVGQGISERGAGRRIISVKGLSEREVPASVATWTVGYSANGNELGEINKKLAESTKAVIAFLKEAGFAETDMAVQPPSVQDTSMEPREKDIPPPPERYKASQSVLLRTAKVDLIKPALASASNLMVSGVLLSGKSEPSYIFDELNTIKPGMIQEATKNARIAAEQFARDAQTALGKLRNASQGWFKIDDRDAATPERKIVRVVVDVEYEIN